MQQLIQCMNSWQLNLRGSFLPCIQFALKLDRSICLANSHQNADLGFDLIGSRE